jgi:tRNA (Thr-GGU) A37 N-methylase
MEESQVKSETSTVAVNLTPTSAEALHALQLRKKIFLLAIFTLAQFMDVAAVSMVGIDA